MIYNLLLFSLVGEDAEEHEPLCIGEGEVCDDHGLALGRSNELIHQTATTLDGFSQ